MVTNSASDRDVIDSVCQCATECLPLWNEAIRLELLTYASAAKGNIQPSWCFEDEADKSVKRKAMSSWWKCRDFRIVISHYFESELKRKLETGSLVRRTRSENWSSCDGWCRKAMLRLTTCKLFVGQSRWWTSPKRACLYTSFPSVALDLTCHGS